MATNAKVTQIATEVLRGDDASKGRVTQIAIEVLRVLPRNLMPTVAEFQCWRGDSENLSLTAVAFATSEGEGYGAALAKDGALETRWASLIQTDGQVLRLTFSDFMDIEEFKIFWGGVRSWIKARLQYLDEGQSQEVIITVVVAPIEFIFSLDLAGSESGYGIVVVDPIVYKFFLSTVQTDIIYKEDLLLMPNWREPVRLSLSYRTGILSALQGGEQRTTTVAQQRYKTSYITLISTAEMHSLYLSGLRRGLKQNWRVPIWTDDITLTVNVIASDTVINVSTTEMKRVRKGGLLFFVKDQYTFEAKTIDSFTENTITLTEPTEHPWNKSTTILFPGFNGYLSNMDWIKSLTDTVHEMEITFEEDPGKVYEDKILIDDPVFMIPPDWKEPPEFKMDQNAEILELGNRREIGINELWPKMTFKFNFSDDPDTIWYIEQFFKSKMGRLKSDFKVPSWKQDLKLREPISAEDTILDVENARIIEQYLEEEKDCFIALIYGGDTLDPSYIIRQIIASTADTVTLDEAVGEDLSEDTLISLLYPVRFDQDELEWSYQTNRRANTQLTFKEVEAIEEDVTPGPG